jgi:hypothetical protein
MKENVKTLLFFWHTAMRKVGLRVEKSRKCARWEASNCVSNPSLVLHISRLVFPSLFWRISFASLPTESSHSWPIATGTRGLVVRNRISNALEDIKRTLLLTVSITSVPYLKSTNCFDTKFVSSSL